MVALTYSQFAPTIRLTVFPTFKWESVTRVVPIFLLVIGRSISLWGMVAGEALFVTLLIYLNVVILILLSHLISQQEL